MESTRHLLDLPTELLADVLRASGIESTLSAARCCRSLCALARSEPLWQSLCMTWWPYYSAASVAWAEVSRPSLSNNDSWYTLCRSRMTSVGKGWQLLLNLYDRTLVHALADKGSDDKATWLSDLGWLLIEVDRVRRVLHKPEITMVVLEASIDPVYCQWRSAMAAMRVLERVYMVAEELAGDACAVLDEWYDLQETGAAAAHRGWSLLRRAFRHVSALDINLYRECTTAGEMDPASGALSQATKRVCEVIMGLRREGCDLSLPASWRPTYVADRRSPTGHRHWW